MLIKIYLQHCNMSAETLCVEEFIYANFNWEFICACGTQILHTIQGM
jgi:hypothetical protein